MIQGLPPPVKIRNLSAYICIHDAIFYTYNHIMASPSDQTEKNVQFAIVDGYVSRIAVGLVSLDIIIIDCACERCVGGDATMFSRGFTLRRTRFCWITKNEP